MSPSRITCASYPLPDNILSAGNEQDLSAGMSMPAVPCSGFKRYIPYRAMERAVIGNQHLKPYIPDEMVVRNSVPGNLLSFREITRSDMILIFSYDTSLTVR